MKCIIADQDDRIGRWVAKHLPGFEWYPGRSVGIGLEERGELLAGVLYEDHNGVNVVVHVAAVSGRRWLNREFLRYCFEYPFDTLGVRRITAIIDEDNTESRAFTEHAGFHHEATLKDACPGGDILIYVLRRADCRYLEVQNVRIQ